MVSYAFAALLLGQPAPQLDLTYKTVGDREMKLDFYPAAAVAGRKSPFVLVIHGGAWVTGKRQDVSAVCLELSKMGISSATPSYRLAPTFKWPAQIDDVQSAVRFFRANADKFNLQTDKVGAIGFSAGAHLALLLGSMDTRDNAAENQRQSSRVQAVLNVYGPTDLLSDFEPFLAGMIAQQLVGKTIDKAEPEMKSFSPVNLITKSSAPTFTIHGTADKVVPVNQATRLDEAFRKAGAEHTMRIIPEFGHENPAVNPKALGAFREGAAWLIKRISGGRS